MPNLRNGRKGGFEPGLTRLRVLRSTTELPRATCSIGHLLTTEVIATLVSAFIISHGCTVTLSFLTAPDI